MVSRSRKFDPLIVDLECGAIVLTPTRSRITSAVAIVVLMCLAVLGPWIAERLGVLPVAS